MDFYAPISVYRSAFDHAGWQMSLAEFMNLGKEKYAADIIAYRTLKASISELNEQQEALSQYRSELDQNISAGINPLGGENTPEVDALIAERSKAEAQLEVIHADIAGCRAKADEIKRRFPAATISGLFAPTRAQSNLKQHSGFMCIDIDDHYEMRDASGVRRTYRQDLVTIPSILASLPYVLYASHSVGGAGYFAIIPLGPVDEQHTHAWYFESLQDDFKRLGVVIDPACRDTTRLRFVSYDTHPYRNPKAEPYLGQTAFVSRNERRRRDEEAHRRAEQERRNAMLNANDPDRDFRHVQICVDKAIGSGVVDSYDNWYKSGVCLARAFGERGRSLFHSLSSTSAKYNAADTDKKFDSCLSAASHASTSEHGSLSIKSLFALFESYNIRWYRD